MKKFLLIFLFMTLFNITCYADLKTETHGRKHKSLPEIPLDEEANRNGFTVSFEENTDGLEKDRFLTFVYEGSECIDSGFDRKDKHECKKWEKEYRNGKLYRYTYYEIIPSKDFNQEKIKDHVEWNKNGQVNLIRDSKSCQYFDHLGNLRRECKVEDFGCGDYCARYEEESEEWVMMLDR